MPPMISPAKYLQTASQRNGTTNVAAMNLLWEFTTALLAFVESTIFLS